MYTKVKHSQIKKTRPGESGLSECVPLHSPGIVSTDPARASYMDRDEINKRLRSERLRVAKLKGDHTKEEWNEMVMFFDNTCVKCLGKSGYIGVCKDHIIPLYQGGSNGLDNIQPLCALCNASKGPEDIDWRPQAENFWNITMPDKYKPKVK